MNYINNNSQGFTLIEVLVVVLIVGILTSVALPQYQKAVEKSRAAEAMILAKALGEAEQVYYATYNRYATTIDELDLSVPTSTKDWESILTFANYDYHPVVYVRSANPSSQEETWYIYYTLTDDRLWCGARAVSEKNNKLCRSIGKGTPQYCTPAGSDVNCYLIE